MYRMPYYNQNRYQQTPMFPIPPQKKKKWRFRKSWLYVPLAVTITLFFLAHIDFAYSWEDIMGWLDVNNREKYTKLCVLGLICIGIAALQRAMKDEGD